MDRVVRVGIAGLGIAARQIVPAFEYVTNARLTAVADIRVDELQKWRRRFGVETFSSVEDMCRFGNIDAVWIATPNQLHAEHTIIAAEHGKHVICEKPMAVTLEQADRMIDAIQRNGVKYVQGHTKIYEKPIQKMAEIISSGKIGRVIHINTMNYNDWLRRPYMPSEVDVGHGGGVVYRQGPHQIDIVRFLGGGMVRSVRGAVGRWNPYFNCEGNYAVFMEFENGVTATVTFVGYGHLDIAELTWNIGEGARKHTRKQLWGPRAKFTGPISAEMKYLLPEYSLDAILKRSRQQRRWQPFFGLTIVSCEYGDLRQSPRGIYIYTEVGREEVPCEPYVGRIGELKELVDAVFGDRYTFPDVYWAKATLEVLLAIYKSARERKEVCLRYQVPVRRSR
ncbi:MAG TPA: Gfo/Idh/MocA family oxidoreductase [Chloroflexota bacterium]|nr:Gfo/Idh/MocA family oxidoreductase [Chloroflexota bacterium]